MYVIYYRSTHTAILPWSFMALLPRKAVLSIAAVVDVALQGRGRPVSAKTLAARHGLPPRHLEPVLQALVRDGILKGVRGPHGGYALARERRRVTVIDVLRAAGTVDEANGVRFEGSDLVEKVVMPALDKAEKEFEIALGRISIDDMTRSAEKIIPLVSLDAPA
jgi:Rrf2 family transcriptional regulator, iron-sulfur cluster assembly transcription factor